MVPEFRTRGAEVKKSQTTGFPFDADLASVGQ
jgi:hypothetical protein